MFTPLAILVMGEGADLGPGLGPTLSPRTPSKISSLRYVTLDLIRKRSEHNDGMVSTLEELALHQEDLEAVGPVLGRTCGRTLRILLLQNNVISALSVREMRSFVSLRYLNLALNNLTRVPGEALVRCEALEKLDITLNFVDVGADGIRSSIDGLVGLGQLQELHLAGNPCMQRWEGCRPFVVARLPLLRVLDGREVARSERIVAEQRLPGLEAELKDIEEVEEVGGDILSPDSLDPSKEKLTGHAPEVRAEISRDTAQQRAAREEQDRANAPHKRGEKEMEEEHMTVLEREKARAEKLAAAGGGGNVVKQCNEGRLAFSFDEESEPNCVLLNVSVQRFLSSTLIDVDVHPRYISVVVRNKVLRLVLPAQVRAEESTARRSQTTGRLLVTMPKVHPSGGMVSICAARRLREEAKMTLVGERGEEKDKRRTLLGTREGASCNKSTAECMLEASNHWLKTSLRADTIAEGEDKETRLIPINYRRPVSVAITTPETNARRASAVPQGISSTVNFDGIESEDPPMMY